MVVRLGDAVGMGLVAGSGDDGFLRRLGNLVEETGAYKVLKDYPVGKLPDLGVDEGNMDVVIPALARCYGVHAGPAVDLEARRKELAAILTMMGIDPAMVGSVNGVPMSGDVDPSDCIDNGEGLVLNVPLVRALCMVADLGRAGCDVVEHFTRLMSDYPRWMAEDPGNLRVTRGCALTAGELPQEDWAVLTTLMWAVADPLGWDDDAKDAPEPGSKGYDLWLLNHRPDPRNEVISIILNDGFGDFLGFTRHAAGALRALYRAPFWDFAYLDRCAALGRRPDPMEAPAVGWPDRYGYLDHRILQLARRFVLERDWHSLGALGVVLDALAAGARPVDDGRPAIVPALGKRVKLPLPLFTGLDRSRPVGEQAGQLVAAIPFTDHPEDVETIDGERVDELFDGDGLPRHGYVPEYDPAEDDGDVDDDRGGADVDGVDAADPTVGERTGDGGGVDAARYLDDVSDRLSSFFLGKAKGDGDLDKMKGNGDAGKPSDDQTGGAGGPDAAASARPTDTEGR